jgi:hypothetical protein
MRCYGRANPIAGFRIGVHFKRTRTGSLNLQDKDVSGKLTATNSGNRFATRPYSLKENTPGLCLFWIRTRLPPISFRVESLLALLTR